MLVVTSNTILLVEDQALIAISLGAALEKHGYVVTIAASGSAAIAAISAIGSGPGAMTGLITDIDLRSGPDGWEVARQARLVSPMLPIVYVTGRSARHHEQFGVPKSVLIDKPFAEAQVVDALTQLIDDTRS
ncbi:MAG: response regulator [Sphingomonadaceae bacterium]